MFLLRDLPAPVIVRDGCVGDGRGKIDVGDKRVGIHD